MTSDLTFIQFLRQSAFKSLFCRLKIVKMGTQRIPVRISKIIRETEAARTFVLEPLDGRKIKYKPGQFLTFIFQTTAGEQRRNYSISSCPDMDEPLSITIKRLPNGNFSRLMVDKAKEGDILTTIGAHGFFTLPENIHEYKQVFLLAAGSGITPIISLIKTLLIRARGIVVNLIYSNNRVEDAIFYDQLLDLERRYPGRLQIEWLFSNAPAYTRARLSNWLLSQLLDKYRTAPLDQCLFYICGPFNYMLVMQITLVTAGVKPAQIRKEEFVTHEQKTSSQPPDTKPHQVKIVLDNNNLEFTSAWPATILQSAKKAGIELPYSCEVGRCGACAALCTSGKVWMKYNEVLTNDDIRSGRVLTCTGYPVDGDVQLDFDKVRGLLGE